MRILKLTGALVVVLAFSAIAVATASAAETLWKWLPGSVGETFTGKSGVVTLSFLDEGGKKTIGMSCKKSLTLLTFEVEPKAFASSELLKEGSTEGKDATLALIIMHLEGCTSAGLPFNSTGDSSGIILLHIEAHNCMIAAGDFGWLLKLLPLGLEIPTAKVKLQMRGSIIGLLEGKEGEKKLTFGLNLKTVKSEGKAQEFTKCLGGETDKLEMSLDGIVFEPAFQDVKEGSISFDMTKDKEGEEMMEK